MKREFLGPGNICQGMLSDVDQTTLPKGFWGGLFNLRCRGRSLTVRDGSTKLNSAVPIAAASYRGCWLGYIGTTERMVVAFRVGAATQVFEYNLTANTWAEVTDATSRFATDGNVSFAPIKTRTGLYLTSVSGLLIQNGTDTPRVWYPGAVVYRAPGQVNLNGSYPAARKAYPAFSVDLASGVWTRARSNALQFEVTRPSTSLVFEVFPAVTINQTAEARGTTFKKEVNTAGTSCVLGSQFCLLVYDVGAESVMDYINDVSVYDVTNGIYVSVWNNDGTNDRGSYSTHSFGAQTGYTNCRLFIFETGGRQGTSIDGIRFNTNGNVPAGTVTSRVAFIGTGGEIPQSTSFASSFRDDTTMVESIATPARNVVPSYLFGFVGGSKDVPQVAWPVSANLLTSYYLITGFGSFTGSAIFYATAPGGTDYGMAAINGGSVVAGEYRRFFTSIEPDFTTLPYDESYLAIPTGLPMVAVGGRVKIGSGQDDYTSAYLDPMAWRKSVVVDASGTVDETSPCFNSYPGEAVSGYAVIQGTQFNSFATVIFTSKATYRENSGTASAISAGVAILGHRGTKHLYSIAQDDGQVVFLDSEYEIRGTNGGTLSNAMSINTIGNRVRNQTLSSGGISLPASFAAFDLFGMVYRGVNPVTGTPDTLNNEAVIYDRRTGNWQVDRFPFDCAGLMTREGGGIRYLLAVTNLGDVWRLYVPGQTTENGSALPVYIQSWQICEGWEPVVVKQIGIVTDASGTVTWNTKRYNFPAVADGNPDGTISLTGTTSGQAWRSDQSTGTGAGIPGLKGWSVYFALWGDIPGGAVIRGIRADIESRGVPGQAQP